MLRSLFDDMERRPLSVSELTSQVRGTLERRFASVWVEGEISNFGTATSGHWYFTLKDDGAQLHAKCFRSVNYRIRFRPTDGLLVRARGRLTLYEPRGEYQLQVEALEPVGAGALRIAFEQLKERLEAEGLFDKNLKRDLPVFPRRIGVITSPAGAALRDIIRTVERRTRTVHLLVVPTRVQGEGAAREIAHALRVLNHHHSRAVEQGRLDDTVDAIILGRGGGSAEDLWAFNEEIVARAIRKSLVPVISAVGHETDFTIADFAADVRAATPTAAAEIVARREDEIAAYVDELSRTLVSSIRHQLIARRARAQYARMSPRFDEVRARLRSACAETAATARRIERAVVDLTGRTRRRLDAATSHLSPANMASRAAAVRGRLDVTRAELESTTRARVEDARVRLAVAGASLDALSPLAVLGRGYALVRDERGRVVRVASSVTVGERIGVRLDEGALRCRVEAIEDGRKVEGA